MKSEALSRGMSPAAVDGAEPGVFDCDPETKRKIVNRLRRARGQLDAVIEAAERGESCKTTVMQLSAVTHALNRAGFVIIANAMQGCIDAGRVEDGAASGDGGAGADAAGGAGVGGGGASRGDFADGSQTGRGPTGGGLTGGSATDDRVTRSGLTLDELEKIFLSLV